MQLKKRIQAGALLLAAALLPILAAGGYAAQETDAPASAGQTAPAQGTASLSKGPLTLSADEATGFLTVTDGASGMTYASNPADYELDTVAQGVNITRMISQLLVTFLNGNQAMDEVNSYVGSVSEGGLRLSRDGDTLTATYTFAEQGFVIPVRYSLTADALSASIDYGQVRETGDCRILDITLLPFFGAARSGDKGFFILPDGSGAYVAFNNGRYAQGEYRREIFGGDLTQVSESKPNDYKPVLLPAFAAVYTHATPPLRTDENGSPVQEAGRDVQAGFLAIARRGAAGGTLSAAVAGMDTGYNTAGFTFLYRTSMETTFLSRTWAEMKRILTAQTPCTDENPTVEYRFLRGEAASLKGAADACADWLLDGAKRGGSLNDALYLDVTAGVRAKQQFLGFGYQAVTPLTTLRQTGAMLTELRDGGVGRFVVLLRGLSPSGAYTGKIDAKLKVDGKLGSAEELRDLIETWTDVYPEVRLTQFTDGGNGAHAFFDSVTAVNKKTAKLFDYHYATGLRDYSRPTRYLLRPEGVEKAAGRLADDVREKGLETLAPSSLGRDLYSNYGGGDDPLGRVQERFTRVLADLAQGRRLLLEAPNAYAMPYAENFIGLPHTDSGHFISNGAVPFLQLVLDGLKGYATPPVNYAGDLRDMLLHAVESNSALTFSVMEADYEAVARTSMNRLYASTYAQWKDTMLETYCELAAVRERTGGTAVAGYVFLSRDVRQVTFENGAVVVVNYGTAPYERSGLTVPAKSYGFIGGRDGS